MNGFGPPDDDPDDCGCGLGQRCATHEAAARARREASRADYHRRGIDPDAEVPDRLVGILLAIDACPAISEQQREAIHRILFPYGKPPR